jgi:hypothetical protein
MQPDSDFALEQEMDRAEFAELGALPAAEVIDGPDDWYADVARCAEQHKEAAGHSQAERMTLELRQPLMNEFRRRRPRRYTDAPLFDRQEELFR